MANHIEGTIPNFHEFLDSKPNWVELSAKRDAARKAWQDRNYQAHKLVKATHFTQAAEILENRTVVHYQACMDEDQSTAIYKWTGIHPELSVEIYNEVIEHLRDQAFLIYEELREYKAETNRLEGEYNLAQSMVSKLYDELREEYNKLQRSKE